MIKKCLYSLYGNFIGRNKFTLNSGTVTNDGDFFAFPENSVLNHLISVRVSKESCYDDVTFRFNVSVKDVVGTSRLGICLKSATDIYDGERAMFVIGGGKVAYYNGNTKQLDLGDFDIAALNNTTLTISMRRWNDWYYFTLNGITYSRRIKGDGTYYRQNIQPCLYGSLISARINRIEYCTDAPDIQFGILGDSIANGYASAGGGWEDTIKGILSMEYGVAIGEFAGSANVIKDQLDGMNELAILKPEYAIVMYGHNDVFANTGRLFTDYPKMIDRIKNYGIAPIIVNLNTSAWIDESIVNNFLTQEYFNDRYLHIDLTGVLGPGDFVDGVHPNVGGNRKLAEVVLDFIQPLL